MHVDRISMASTRYCLRSCVQYGCLLANNERDILHPRRVRNYLPLHYFFDHALLEVDPLEVLYEAGEGLLVAGKQHVEVEAKSLYVLGVAMFVELYPRDEQALRPRLGDDVRAVKAFTWNRMVQCGIVG